MFTRNVHGPSETDVKKNQPTQRNAKADKLKSQYNPDARGSKEKQAKGSEGKKDIKGGGRNGEKGGPATKEKQQGNRRNRSKNEENPSSQRTGKGKGQSTGKDLDAKGKGDSQRTGPSGKGSSQKQGKDFGPQQGKPQKGKGFHQNLGPQQGKGFAQQGKSFFPPRGKGFTPQIDSIQQLKGPQKGYSPKGKGAQKGKSFDPQKGKSFELQKGFSPLGKGAQKGKSFAMEKGFSPKGKGAQKGKSFEPRKGKSFEPQKGKSFGPQKGKSFEPQKGKSFGPQKGKSFGPQKGPNPQGKGPKKGNISGLSEGEAARYNSKGARLLGKNLGKSQSKGKSQLAVRGPKGNGKSRSGGRTQQVQPARGQTHLRKGKGKGVQKPGSAKEDNKMQPSGRQSRKKASRRRSKRDNDTFGPNPVNRRSSLLTTLPLADANDLLALYNARADTFPSGDNMIGPLEIIFIDPPNTEKKNTTGIVVVFHGMEPTKGTMIEWSQIPELTKWLEMGFTVALPNLEMHSAIHKTDVEKYVRCAMGSKKLNTCILLGKGWGGNVCIQYALDHPNQVKGLILLAPSGPPRQNARKLKMPVLVAWAEGDPVIPIEESSEFLTELRSRDAPTAFKLSDQKTHNFADVLENDSAIVDSLTHFVAAVTIMAQKNRTEVVKRLSKVLPERMQSDDPEVLRKLATELPAWVRSGLETAHE